MNNAEKWQMGGVKSYKVIDQTEAASDLSESAGSVPTDTQRLDWLLYTSKGLAFMVECGTRISRTQIDAEMEAQNRPIKGTAQHEKP